MGIGPLVDLMLRAGVHLEARRSSGGGRAPASGVWTLEHGWRGDLEWRVKKGRWHLEKGRCHVVHVEKGWRLLQRAGGGPAPLPKPVWALRCNTHFLQELNFCPHRSAYKNAYQIVVHMKNFPKINLV
jgi:hypothetical protein